MTQKPSLKAATPNDESANGLLDDVAHEFLTKRLADPTVPNVTLAVGVLRVVEAGGHDVNGDPITKVRFDHLEIAYDEKSEKRLTDALSSMHRNRTSESTVAALNPPSEDTPLDMPEDAVEPGDENELA